MTSTPPRSSVGLRRAVDPTVRAIVLEGFFTRLGFGMVTFALPLYALHLGMSIAEVGLVAGAKALVQPAVKPLMGRVVDRFGARRGYLAAVSLRFVGALLLLVVTTPKGLLAVRFLQGAASAARDPASVTVLAKRVRTGLGSTFSLAIAGKDVGAVSAGLAAGGLLALTGGSFTVLWWAVVALAAVPVGVVAAWIPEVSEPRPAPPEKPDDGDAPGAVLRHPRLRLVAAVGLLAGLTAHMTHALFQVYASEVAGLEAGQIGLIYSLSIASLLLVGPLAGRAADRHGTSLLVGARGVANALSSALFFAFPSFGGALAGRLVDDAGKAAFRPTWGALVATAARAAGPRAGSVAAGLETALSLGEALGPLLAGVIWDLWGLAVFFAVRALLGIGTELVLGRRLRAGADDVGEEASREAEPRARPGPGRLVVEEVGLDGLPGRVSFVCEPRRTTAIRVQDPALARRLVEIVAGLRAPRGGRVLVDGCDLHASDAASLRDQVAALVSPQPAAQSTLAEVLAAGCRELRWEDLARAWHVSGLGSAVGPLDAAAEVRAAQLSPGERGRLAIAAALALDPSVLVIDEGELDATGELNDALERVLSEHLGAVAVVRPHPRRLLLADVVVDLTPSGNDARAPATAL